MKHLYTSRTSEQFLRPGKRFWVVLLMTIILPFRIVSAQETVTTIPALETGNVVNICQAGSVVVSVNNTNPARVYFLNQTGVGLLQSLPGNGGVIVFNPLTYPAAGSYSHLMVSSDYMFFMTFSTMVWTDPAAPAMVPNPPGNTVEAGMEVSASVGSPGTGGYNCGDSFQFRSRAGTTWTGWINYTPETAISTTGLDEVEIRTVRSNPESPRACFSENVHSWTVCPYINISDAPPSLFPTLQEAIDAPTTTSGETIRVAAGNFSIPAATGIHKSVTIEGSGEPGSFISGLTFSGAMNALNISESGVIIQNLNIEKSDKTGPSRAITIQAANCTIQGNRIHGNFVQGDTDLTTGILALTGATGLTIANNQVYSLRWPGQFTGSAGFFVTGSITGNTVHSSLGFEIDQADMTFNSNTWNAGWWTYNYTDVVILPGTDASLYPDIVAVSEANNDAVIEDLRVFPAVLSVVYTNPSFGGISNGGVLNPYRTLTEAIARVVPQGKIKAGPGSYHEQVTINKSLNLTGNGNGVNYICAPVTRSNSILQDTTVWDYIVAAVAPSGTIKVRIEGFAIIDSNRNKMPGTHFLAGLFMRDVSGEGSGYFSGLIRGFPQTPEYECSGIKLFGNSAVTLNNNDILEYTADGIGVQGGSSGNPDVVISNNHIYGSEISLNGISLENNVTGTTENNYLAYHRRTSPVTGCGMEVTGCVGLTIHHNQVVSSFHGLDMKNCSNLVITDNSIESIRGTGYLMDNVFNSDFLRNQVVSPDTSIRAGLVIAGNSSGNQVGSEGNGNGFIMSLPCSGEGVGVLLENSPGGGNNTISYNVFHSGKRYIQQNNGFAGTTTISHNGFGWDGASLGSVAVFGGNAVIEENHFNPNTIRGILVDGAHDIDISKNTFTNGSSEYAIKIVSATGNKLIHENAFGAISGTALIAKDGADNLQFTCNSFRFGGAGTGVVIEPGCTGASITDNYFHYIAHQCIISHEPLTGVNNNFFANSDIGIETWSDLDAHENMFLGLPNGGIIAHSAVTLDVTGNSMGWAGPKVLCGLMNHNSYFQSYQSITIFADSANVRFAPWLMSDTDNDTETCGFQPVPGNLYAPVYANSDGSSEETELYGSVSDAVSATGLPFVFARAGEFTEQVTIHKSLELKGAGINQTLLRPPQARTGIITGGSGTWDYLLAAEGQSGAIRVKIDGFSFLADTASKSPGSDFMAAILLKDVKGESAGLFNSKTENFRNSGLPEYYGLNVEGNSSVDIGGNKFYHYNADGVRIGGGRAAIADNFFYGDRSQGSGISFSQGTSGVVSHCEIQDHSGAGLAGIEARCDSLTVTLNKITNCYYGINQQSAAGVNNITANRFDGGFRHLLVEAGAAGQTLVDTNLFGYGKADSASVLLRGGDLVVSRNNFYPEVKRGVIVENGGSVDILQNVFSYLVNGEAIKVVSASGPKNISENVIYAQGGTGLIAGTGAGNFVAECNAMFSLDYGITIDEGCDGVAIRDNQFNNLTRTCLKSHGSLSDVSGNFFSWSQKGIETWNEMTARKNMFTGIDSGAIIFYTNHFHDVTQNSWNSGFGPKVYLNGININSYYSDYQSAQFIQAFANDNFRYAPYNRQSWDTDPVLCGYQPDTTYLFAPVYANADGSATETEQYGSINEAVTKTDLPYVFARQGNFTEQITIKKSVTLTGDGDNTIIYAPEIRREIITEDTTAWDYLVAADAPSGLIRTRLNHIHLNGHNLSKMDGTDFFTALIFRNAGINGSGFFKSTIGGFPEGPAGEFHGIKSFGAGNMVIDSNVIGGHTGDAIEITGGNARVSNNKIYGSLLNSESGIVFGAQASGNITRNSVWNHAKPGTSGIFASHDGIRIDSNSIVYSANGIIVDGANGVNVNNNTINFGKENGLVLHDVSGSLVQDNYIQDQDGTVHAAVDITGNSSGNLIGGEGHYNVVSQNNVTTGSGDMILVHVEATAGNNLITYNHFGGGKKGIRTDPGFAGLITIDHNDFAASDEACISLASGDALIANNFFGSNLIRGIDLDGVHNFDVINNYFNYGCSDYALKITSASGAKNVTDNCFFALSGTAVIAEDGADSLNFNCNSFRSGGALRGLVVEPGCKGVNVTNNFFHYIAQQCIVTHEPLLTVYNNFFHNGNIGIETWSELKANYNSFWGLPGGALIFHSNDAHDVRNNAWYSGFGPWVFLNGVNVNTYNPHHGHTEFIQANENDNFRYAPYLFGEDTDPTTCGYQPDTTTSFAPVYANTDGSATETEQYPTITDALFKSALPYIRAKSGRFDEKLEINHAVDLKGNGYDQSVIYAVELFPGNVVDINVPSGDVAFDGFTLRNNSTQDIMSAYAGDPSSSIRVTGTKFFGAGTPSLFDHGFLNKPGNPASVCLSGNLFSNLYNFPVLLDRNPGSVRITHNNLDGIFPAICFRTNGGIDVSTVQQVDSNSFNLWTSDTTRMTSAISFTGAYREDPSISQGSGIFSNIDICKNDFRDIPSTQNPYHIISLANDDPDGTGGLLSNPGVRNNYFAVYGMSGTAGITLEGLINSARVTSNEMHGVFTGILSQSGNHGSGIQFPINTLMLDNLFYGNSQTGSAGIKLEGGSGNYEKNSQLYYFDTGVRLSGGADASLNKTTCYIDGTGVDAAGAGTTVNIDSAHIYFNHTGVVIRDGALLNYCRNNSVNNNDLAGILIGSAGQSEILRNNEISYNGFAADPVHGIGIQNDNPANTVDARYNYWGGWPYQEPHSTCGEANAILGKVDFLPILSWIYGDSLFPRVSNVSRNPNSYYCKIQDAIDDAGSGDEIDIPAGDYHEQLTVTKSLKLVGTGPTNANIYVPETRTRSVLQDTTVWDYVLAAYALSGTIDFSVRGLSLVSSCHKTEGTDYLAGLFLRDVSGTHAGMFKSIVSVFPGSYHRESSGISIFGNSNLAIDSITSYYSNYEGIGIHGGNAVISHNVLYGTELSGNGIVLDANAKAHLLKNAVCNFKGAGGFGMVIQSDSTHVDSNYLPADANGIIFSNVTGIHANGNFLNLVDGDNWVLDNVRNSFFLGNSTQDPPGTCHAGMVLRNGSTGNQVGSESQPGNFMLHQAGPGTLTGILIEGSTGSGTNTISHNIFSGGNRYIHIESGNTGTTTIEDNYLGWGAAADKAIEVNGGNVVITGNSLASVNARGILVDGAHDFEISHNIMSYGVPDYAIKITAATGSKRITNNIIGIQGKAVICEDGADDLYIGCNSLAGSIGVEVNQGATGVKIQNNEIPYCQVAGVSAHESLSEFTGNIFSQLQSGMETWSDLDAHHNIFSGNNRSLIIHNPGNHDLRDNYWGYYGPAALHNGINLNTWYQQYQDQTIETADENIRFAPWLQTNSDANPDSCGFQPGEGYSFAPVFANSDGSASETEQFGSIGAGLQKSSQPWVFAKPGEFTEQVTIQREVNLTGAGMDQTQVKTPLTGHLLAPGYTSNNDYLLAAFPANPLFGMPISAKISGFTFDAMQQTHSGDRFTGVFFRKVFGETPESAGLFNCKIKGFNTGDMLTTGIETLEGSKLTLSGNHIQDYSLQGISVKGTDEGPDPVVNTILQTLEPNGAAAGILYENINGTGVMGEIRKNSLTGGTRPVAAEYSDHITIDSNHIQYSLDAGIILHSTNNTSVAGNTVAGFTTKGIVVQGSENLISANDISNEGGNCQAGISLADGGNNQVVGNDVHSIHSGNISDIASCAHAIEVTGVSAGNSIGDGTLANSNNTWYNDAGIVFSGTGNGNSARGNKIHYNSPHGLNNSGGMPVDASLNWWGSPAGPTSELYNPCGNGNNLTDGYGVIFEPWKSSELFERNVYKLVTYNITGPDSVCTQVPFTLSLSGSQVLETGNDYVYKLLRDGVVVWGSDKPGTGNPLTWTVTESWPGSAIYTVMAYNMLSGCELEMTGSVVVHVSEIPAAAGTITGPETVTNGQSGVVFSVEPVANATGYLWILPPGAVITSGENTNVITVTFSANAYSGVMQVAGIRSCGHGALSPEKYITVSVPANLQPGTVTISDNRCYNALQTITTGGSGNIFTVTGSGHVTLIAGQKIRMLPKTVVLPGGYLHALITTGGNFCGTVPPAMVVSGISDEPGEAAAAGNDAFFRIYPNPATGKFTLEFSEKTVIKDGFRVDIYNAQGEQLAKEQVTGERKHVFTLDGKPAGVYFLHIYGAGREGTGKVIRQF